MHTGYLAWLQSSTRDLQWLEYLKSVFLEIPNVTTWLLFQNKLTYCLLKSLALLHYFYPSIIIWNQLPVSKLSAFTTITDMIGYFHEIDLNLSHSGLVVVVTHYIQDGLQWYPNSSYLTVVEPVSK